MVNMDKIDTVLYVNESINEGIYDDRFIGTDSTDARIKWGKGGSYNYDDPTLYANNAFGRGLASELNRLGDGFSAEVCDFGKWVTVRVSHTNYITGKTSSKIFLVVFSNKSKGIVLSTANKWRSIDGYSQAASYIRAAMNGLKSDTQSKL